MPNWCFTHYIAEGPEDEIQKLEDLLNTLADMPHPGLQDNDFGPTWLGNILSALGWDMKDIIRGRCRGTYENVNRSSINSVSFMTETAWCEADDTRHAIEQHFPGVKLYYISEEFGCGYWETNDIAGRYIDEEYYLATDDEYDYDSNYLTSLEDLIKKVSEITGLSELKTLDDCQKALDCSIGEGEYTLYHIHYNND